MHRAGGRATLRKRGAQGRRPGGVAGSEVRGSRGVENSSWTQQGLLSETSRRDRPLTGEGPASLRGGVGVHWNTGARGAADAGGDRGGAATVSLGEGAVWGEPGRGAEGRGANVVGREPPQRGSEAPPRTAPRPKARRGLLTP